MTRRRNTRLEIIPALLFALIPLVFIAGIVGFQLAVNVPNARVARANTLLSFNTIRAANAVDEAIQDAERGQRGFLITGREVYLEPYAKAKERLPTLMAELQQASSGSADQQLRLLKLQADITTKMDELASTITAMRQQGYEPAKTLVNTDAGRLSMESIIADLTSITNAADTRLHTRLQRAAAAEERVSQTFVIASTVAAISLLIGAFLLGRAYRRAATSEQVLQATLDSVREGVAAFDYRGRLRAWNNSFIAMLGLAGSEIRRGAALPVEGGNALGARIRELETAAQSTGRAVLADHEGERGASIEVFHHPTEGGGHVTTLLDVTERRKAEETLRQSQKLESMGRMTGGVAHDFNNLLTIIIGSLGLLRGAIGRDDKARQRIDMMSVAAERASRLTKQLLTFARRQPLPPEIVNLGHVMQEVLPLIRRSVGETVAVECVTAGGLWNTAIDASEFAITDTGKGMAPDTLARALDPFFTTKPAGEGTGLGLPQVYGFVKQSGGHLKLYSEVGEGTTIKVHLPRSFARETVHTAHSGGLVVTGTETVLLVR